ncbi:response regulator receiver protein [Methanoregula boonei 6A8]|jgi:CheY-like chemotaxis protein|uniref:Response regulator receiver protein n=1 Tax=Methanoregula boonei (strain DSM 21154 / JCM 14090 / 6A8) TaxID=456442 RepID=A7IB10_METB6|nr:response regulator [Methanoregula boonei]ABS56921.1 response regulator receiver protein [Methanoregula boonei 6A8]
MLKSPANPAEKRILIVEDEGLVAMTLEETLRRIGYLVVGIALSGEEAITLTGEQHPDVILMDIRLQGGMDGIEAAQKIKGQFGTPIIFLTAYSDDETIRRVVMTESSGYLVKPINTRELFAGIESALYKKRRFDRFMEQQATASRPVCPCGTPMIQAFSPEKGEMIAVGWVCPKCHHFVQGN